MATGHAAGTIAALAAMAGKPASEVDIAQVQATLREQKAVLERPMNIQGDQPC